MPVKINNINPTAIAFPMYSDITQNHLCFMSLSRLLASPPVNIGALRTKQNKRYKSTTPHRKDIANFNNT